MKNKKLVIAIVAVVVIIALMAGIYFLTRPQASTDEKTFTLTVVHADGTENVQTITSSEEFLAPALIAEGIINDEGIETGMYYTVDGETASWEENQSYWAFYVGGDYATEGMNTTAIADGAEYTLEYTIG